jgi:hypothetical protein
MMVSAVGSWTRPSLRERRPLRTPLLAATFKLQIRDRRHRELTES